MGMTNEEKQKFLAEHPGITIAEAPKVTESGNLAATDIVDASRALDADIEIPAPCGLNYLPFQRAGVAYMLSKENHPSRGILLAVEMGLR